ncbi:MAG: hypothetical protein Q9174_001459 [Haloplaca sp. 1 TL-2023]
MLKRRYDGTGDSPPSKRSRSDGLDRLSLLSDELLIVLFSYLPIHDLIRCERLSRRLKSLASDSQIWKAAYYDRFLRHRAARIPGLRETNTFNKSLLYSSKISKWLEDGHLVRQGGATNWKRQYKLRHNWSRGSCRKTETRIAERPSIPPLLVRLHEGTIITADSTAGLRAWSMHGEDRLIATTPLSTREGTSLVPTSLAINNASTAVNLIHVSIGFSDGSFGIYALNNRKRSFSLGYLHPSSINGTISAIAFAFPYVVTLTEDQLLSLYSFPDTGPKVSDSPDFGGPRLLCSLKSYTAWPPLSLAIRRSTAGITTSIAYAMPTYTSGWSVGLQELRLSSDGSIVETRLATPADHGFLPLNTSAIASGVTTDTPIRAFRHRPSSSTKLTTLSYTHPYLLAGHSDNTLILYMVTSNAEELSIAPGTLLCGHTSSVLGTHIGDRGKAVSVGGHGNDLRVWELEGGMYSTISRRRLALGEAGVPIRPDRDIGNELLPYPEMLKSISRQTYDEPMMDSSWLSFDEESVVMLAEKKQGAQALVVYNFA